MKRFLMAILIFVIFTVFGLLTGFFSPETVNFFDSKAGDLTVLELFALVCIASAVGGSVSS
jgi:hypothetical protein